MERRSFLKLLGVGAASLPLVRSLGSEDGSKFSRMTHLQEDTFLEINVEKSLIGEDFEHPSQTNPTLYIFSADYEVPTFGYTSIGFPPIHHMCRCHTSKV